MWRGWMAMMLMMWAGASVAAEPVSLVDVRTGESGERTRIVMASNGQVKWHTTLEGDRLVLRAKSLRSDISSSQIDRKSRLIRQLALKQSGDELELVIQLAKAARVVYSTTMKRASPEDKGMRWVVDLVADEGHGEAATTTVSKVPAAPETVADKAPPAPTAKVATVAEPKRKADSKPALATSKAAAATSAKPLPAAAAAIPDLVQPASKSVEKVAARPVIHPFHGTKPLVVAIDAGHGGKDVGAMGHGGTLEKDITLAMAKELKKQIDAQIGMRAVLTRDEDYFIPLSKRPRLAREMGADVFISLHADSYQQDKNISGASFYVMSWDGASSQLARFVAEHSNSGDGDLQVASWNESLANTIGKMAMTNTITDSERLARSMQQGLKRTGIRLQHRSVQSANFLVLKNIDMPSVLVEMGFISNPQQDKLLQDAEYQRKMARSIVDGLIDFVQVQPEPGVIYANLKVRKGDNLSIIAARHNINADYLARANNLNLKAPLQVGQQLRVPVNVSRRTAMLADSRG